MPSAADPLPGASAQGLDEVLHLRDGTAVRLHAIDLDRGAALCGDERAEIAADVEGRTVGRVAYLRVYGPRAEWTLEVDDAYWHGGLPETLLARLCARAASCGISTFLACVGAAHVRLLALLREEFAARETRDGAHVEIEFSTAPRRAMSVVDTPPARRPPTSGRRFAPGATD